MEENKEFSPPIPESVIPEEFSSLLIINYLKKPVENRVYTHKHEVSKNHNGRIGI